MKWDLKNSMVFKIKHKQLKNKNLFVRQNKDKKLTIRE
jgi:hypothetical protein